jgi:hypothetical protein
MPRKCRIMGPEIKPMSYCLLWQLGITQYIYLMPESHADKSQIFYFLAPYVSISRSKGCTGSDQSADMYFCPTKNLFRATDLAYIEEHGILKS